MSFLHGSLGALGLLMIGFELLTGNEDPLLITVFIHATVAVLGFLLLVLVVIDV